MARRTSWVQGIEKARPAFHDLHATMLHLLGFDHEKLTYRHAGRDSGSPTFPAK
jgi:ssRNA-specific RNase YbeY (16S rRNA maturation enzyme)